MRLRVEHKTLVILMRRRKYRFLWDWKDWQWIFPWEKPFFHWSEDSLEEMRIGPLEVRRMQRRKREK